jgi:hypothetical protein
MKKSKQLFVLVMLLAFNCGVFAAVLPSATSNNTTASEAPKKQLSVTDELRIAQMKAFASMTAEKYGEVRGKKLNLFEKLAFKANQKRAKNLLKAYSKHDEPNVLSKISWLVKGLLLGPIALLIGYLFLKDDDRELIKWIWFGFAGFAVIVAIALLTL